MCKAHSNFGGLLLFPLPRMSFYQMFPSLKSFTPWRSLPTKPRTGPSPLPSCSISALLLFLPASHEDAQTALLAGPHGEELRPPAQSQKKTETPRQQPCEYTIFWGRGEDLAFSLVLIKLWGSPLQRRHLDARVTRVRPTLSSLPPSE